MPSDSLEFVRLCSHFAVRHRCSSHHEAPHRFCDKGAAIDPMGYHSYPWKSPLPDFAGVFPICACNGFARDQEEITGTSDLSIRLDLRAGGAVHRSKSTARQAWPVFCNPLKNFMKLR